jgi:hypothetical protein
VQPQPRVLAGHVLLDPLGVAPGAGAWGAMASTSRAVLATVQGSR